MAHLWLPAEGGAPLDLDDVVVVDAAVLAKLPDPEIGMVGFIIIGFGFGFGAKFYIWPHLAKFVQMDPNLT